MLPLEESMPILSCLRMVTGRWLAAYNRSVADSGTRFAASVRLLADTSTAMDDARTMRSEHPPWCASCGERIGGSVEIRSRGIHARCHGS